MALNKFMHPRNPFKDKKPDFKSLAMKYKEFRQHAVTDLKGRVHIDFKKAECLRALSWALLQEHFQLDVDMPLDRLIPTIPLRLNYILWIEDLVNSFHKMEKTEISGLDVGTGASCIYPLLGARKNNWHFVATETDDFNFNFANNNVEKNLLSSKINIVKSEPKEVLLEAVQNSNRTFDFCMCNPPFFGSNLEAWGITTSRSDDRSEPKSISTASPSEAIFPGGEVEFVRTMISDSHQLKHQVRVYTTMLGKKSSLTILKEDLRRTGVKNFGTTEFCQGRTMRWGLAWSFHPSVKSLKAPNKVVKPKKPLQYIVKKELLESAAVEYCVQGLSPLVLHILDSLKVKYTAKTGSNSSRKEWLLTATENTWSHQRRKRRREQQKQKTGRHQREDGGQEPQAKKLKLSQTDSNEIAYDLKNEGLSDKVDEHSMDSVYEEDVDSWKTECTDFTDQKVPDTTETRLDVTVEKTLTKNASIDQKPTHLSSNNEECGQYNKEETEKDFILKCELCINKDGNSLVIQLEWIDGDSVELMHQVMQHVKNKLKSNSAYST